MITKMPVSVYALLNENKIAISQVHQGPMQLNLRTEHRGREREMSGKRKGKARKRREEI